MEFQSNIYVRITNAIKIIKLLSIKRVFLRDKAVSPLDFSNPGFLVKLIHR